MEESFSARVPKSSAEVRGLVIHDIKEGEGVRQQEEQEDERNEETRDEVNGEVEEVRRDAQHALVPDVRRLFHFYLDQKQVCSRSSPLKCANIQLFVLHCTLCQLLHRQPEAFATMPKCFVEARTNPYCPSRRN